MGKASTMKKLRRKALAEIENEALPCENCGADGIWRESYGVYCDTCFIQLYPDGTYEYDSIDFDEIVKIFSNSIKQGSPLFTNSGLVRPKDETELRTILSAFVGRENLQPHNNGVNADPEGRA